MTGKWDDPAVPHGGWSCIDIEDLEEASAICEMCETQSIRYVHTMEHRDYGTLLCGCICAGHMEENLDRARQREKSYRSRMARRSKWLTRQWYGGYWTGGVEYVNTNGFHVEVYPEGQQWAGMIHDNITEHRIYARKRYPSREAAKLAAFDAMLICAQKWRHP